MRAGVLIMLCVPYLGGGVGTAATPDPGRGWVVSYAANVTDAKTAGNGWWSTAGQISVADGNLVLTPGKWGSGDAFLFTPRFPKSVHLEITCSVAPDTKRAQAAFDVQLNANVPIGTHPQAGYAFRFPIDEQAAPLLLRGENVLERAAEPGVQLRSGRTYRIVAEQRDGVLSLSVDDVQIFTTKDKPLQNGALDVLGLAVRGCTLKIERFAVYTRGERPDDVLRPVAVPAGRRIKIKGPAMCARGLSAHPDDVDHDVVMFAMDGTPEIRAKFERLMDKLYPDNGLNCDQALKFMKNIDESLKYYLVPGPLVNRWHPQLDYPSKILTVEGAVFERGGRRWIAPEEIETAEFSFPSRMLAPDKPFVTAGQESLQLKITDTLTLKCVKLPAGSYLQGSPFFEFPRWQDEYPHEIVLSRPFYISEIPVTQEMFEAVVGKNPSQLAPVGFGQRFRHAKPDVQPDFAVENASWEDIQRFCRVLSEKNGRHVRLPTDGEWEYAARVGTSSPCFGEKYKEQRSFVGDSQGRCEPVRCRKPNAWGLYDMIKSGWELVSDYKADNVREKQVDPQGPPRQAAADHGSGPLHRTRGGSFYNDTHPNLHGATNEIGENEEGLMVFRVVVEE